MKVAIDTNVLFVSRAGVARLIKGLLRGIDKVGDPSLEVVEMCWPVTNYEYRQPQRMLKTLYRELIWSRLSGPALLRKSKADLLHSPGGPYMSLANGMHEVSTLCDVSILRHPERYRPWHRRSALASLKKLGRSEKIITISQFTADEAMSLLGLPAEKFVPIHLGCDFERASTPETPVPELAGREFLLFVGSLEPGKNLSLLKEMYVLAEARGLKLPDLAIVGARWEGVDGEGQPPANWRYLGRLPDEQLVYLYRRSLGLLFPSKYEGFGFPPLEAMTLGCPVVCSKVSSLPEVGGDAVLYAELTPASYLEKVIRLLGEPGLRDDLISRGLAQASLFSWEKCARETTRVYRSAVS